MDDNFQVGKAYWYEGENELKRGTIAAIEELPDTPQHGVTTIVFGNGDRLRSFEVFLTIDDALDFCKDMMRFGEAPKWQAEIEKIKLEAACQTNENQISLRL